MKKTIDISGFSDEELIRKFSVEINGKRFIRANVLDAIGKRNAERANRKPFCWVSFQERWSLCSEGSP